MYKVTTRNKKVKRILEEYISSRKSIEERIRLLQQNPRKESGAHPLNGKLTKKWACWLGSNIRMIYEIDDFTKEIIIDAVGSHKIYF